MRMAGIAQSAEKKQNVLCRQHILFVQNMVPLLFAVLVQEFTSGLCLHCNLTWQTVKQNIFFD